MDSYRETEFASYRFCISFFAWLELTEINWKQFHYLKLEQKTCYIRSFNGVSIEVLHQIWYYCVFRILSVDTGTTDSNPNLYWINTFFKSNAVVYLSSVCSLPCIYQVHSFFSVENKQKLIIIISLSSSERKRISFFYFIMNNN